MIYETPTCSVLFTGCKHNNVVKHVNDLVKSVNELATDSMEI